MKVSFVLPAYKAKFFDEAIESILNQTYTDFELIVVDDDSPENLREILSKYCDPRIKYFKNERNIGGKNLVYQWNHSIQYASGEYIVLAADDDVYDSRFLENMVNLARKYPSVDLLRARVQEIDENGNLLAIDGVMPEHCSQIEFVYGWKRATILTCIGNYMFKSEVLKKLGFINFPSAFCSDVASTINLASNGVANTWDIYFSFRVSSIHLSSSKNHLDAKLEAINQFYSWILALELNSKVKNDLDMFFIRSLSDNAILEKYEYDIFNQVIKHLSVDKLNYIKKVNTISLNKRVKMIGRYFFNRLFR